jgi:hypothetical protein
MNAPTPLHNIQMREVIDELIRRRGSEGTCRLLNDAFVEHGFCPVSDADELRSVALLIDGLR